MVSQGSMQSTVLSFEALDSSCCSYFDSGNPFPCCTDGNCTWWAYREMGGVPFTGNAGTWWGQVPDNAGWDRAGSPPYDRHSIAWQGGSPGHVAYVATYSGAGNEVDVTDMTCGTQWSCVRSTTKPVSHYGGFIYPLFS
jgi:surface antigen